MPRKKLTAEPAVRKVKTAERVAGELRREIVTGNLRPGDKLNPENVLQTQFGISRPTLREALRLLEAESLITISRGQYGGAKVTPLDLGVAARQVGVWLQMEGTTLDDVWQARQAIEPPAAGLLAARRDPVALEALAANIRAEKEAAAADPIRYADLSAEFSHLITQHCGSRTIHLMAMLLRDIIRRQHEHATAKTYAKSGIEKLRAMSIKSREKAFQIISTGDADAATQFWRDHIKGTQEMVVSAYRAQIPINVLDEPVEAVMVGAASLV